MKVYVVISEQEVFYSGRGYDVEGVFEHKEEALLKMEEILKKELSEAKSPYEDLYKTDNGVFVQYGEHDWLDIKVIESEVQ